MAKEAKEAMEANSMDSCSVLLEIEIEIQQKFLLK